MNTTIPETVDTPESEWFRQLEGRVVKYEFPEEGETGSFQTASRFPNNRGVLFIMDYHDPLSVTMHELVFPNAADDQYVTVGAPIVPSRDFHADALVDFMVETSKAVAAKEVP